MKHKLLLALFLFFIGSASANNMLVQNVITLVDNPVDRTIQIQLDMSWDNSWRDATNYDAAWVFVKFKDASGLWQHAKLNQTGFITGSGTPDSVKVSADSVGAWVYRSGLGSGTFTTTGMQLQWNYGASGLTSVTGLEVRVFAVEMVYVPEGDFNVAKGFYVAPSQCCGGGSMNGSFNAPGSNFPVINQRLTPSLTYSDGTSATLRIKGDAGVDTNNDGVIDNTTYPTGYRPFYCYKYELTEQQYADFLNTLTTAQISTLGIAGTSITLTNGQYFSSTPNKACGNSNATKLFAFADWSGLRPISILEFNKASYGPIQPILHNNPYNIFYAAWNSSEIPNNFGGGTSNLRDVGFSANSTTTRGQAGASYYGIMDLTGNATEPVVKMNDYSFSNVNGNGLLQPSGVTDISTWLTSNIIFIDQVGNVFGTTKQGFRSVRSAE